MTYSERTTCRLCSGPLTEILRLADTPVANALAKDDRATEDKYPLWLAQCRDCGHVQNPVVIEPALLFPNDYPYVSGTSSVFVRHLAEQAAAVTVQCGLQAGDLVLEIGSNDGTLLRLLRERGYRAIGVDPATNLARGATNEGLLTFAVPFGELVGKSVAENVGRARVVLANNVLAHSDQIRDIIRGIAAALDAGGTLVLEVGYLPDQVATNGFTTIYAEHLAFWHLEPLRRVLEWEGLHAYHAHRVDSQGGSIRVYAQKAGKVVPPWTSTFVGLLTEEASLPEALKAWPARIDAATTALYKMLKKLKGHGKTIAGYGAAAKATTLLHQCGIGRDLLDCVFDANPRKIGRFLPGSHIPIVDKAELEKRAPDYCVILSGNFAESIVAQHPSSGGRWGSPLPMPVVLGEEMAA